MKGRFFVLFCPKNTHRPQVISAPINITAKLKTYPSLQFQQFNSEIQAQKFVYPLKISFLSLEQQRVIKDPIKTKQNQEMKKSSKQKIQKVEESGQDQQNEVRLEKKYGEKKETVFNSKTILQIKKVFQEIKGYFGNSQSFVQSKPKMKIKQDKGYFAFFDGCSKGNPGQSGIGYCVMNQAGTIIFERCANIGHKTNNQAQFTALVSCLLDCKFNRITKLTVFGDSELAVKGVKGENQISDNKLKYLNILARQLGKYFNEFTIKHIERSKNSNADALANKGVQQKCISNKALTFDDVIYE